MRLLEKDKLEIIKKLKDVLSREKEILFAYIHGSFLSEEKFEDVDIALYLEEEAIKNIDPLEKEILLALKLEKVIKKKVDIKILNFSPLSFRYNATSGYLLFSLDENKREEFLCRTWSEYFDFLPVSKIYFQEVLGAQV